MKRMASFGVALARGQELHFRFDGKPYMGMQGDTLASALLANGVRTVGRSFKFHRPRGVYTCGVEEPNALVQLESGARTTPAVRTTLVDLYEGLEAHAPSGWPSLGFDLGRALDFVAPLWAAGFYNKTFKWPSWHAYEWAVRRMAGFGHAPAEPDPDRYETRNLHCDVLVVGGGVAGMREAGVAANAGSNVVLVEQGSELGGRLAWDGSSIGGIGGAAWVEAEARRLSQVGNIRILRRTTAVGHYDRDVVALLESLPVEEVRRGAPRERYWIVRAKRIVLATGAIEQPLVFSNNDRPGVMLAGAAHQYLRRHAVAIGARVLVATNNNSAYALARDLKVAGVEVVGVADSRHEVPPIFTEAMCGAGIPVWSGSIPIDTTGFGGLTEVTVGRLSQDAMAIESSRTYRADALAISGSWNPALSLYSQAGGKLVYREPSGTLGPAAGHPLVKLVGTEADESLPGIRVSPVGDTRRQWVDLRHDVTVADLELALRENYSSIEHVKRHTTVGMALDQGKTSNVVALEIVARLRGRKPSELGHTTLRPPFVPVTLGAIAGRGIGERFAPARVLPMHDWHVAHGGAMEDYGEWKRPAYYGQGERSRAVCIAEEARAVRLSAGLFDASSLGKIEVHGPDALDFLDRFYINNLATLQPGKVRYGIMLRESGVVFDDGTVVMLAPDRLLVTTTSGNAGRVAAWLEEWYQCEWPHLRVALTPVTEQWATVSLAGPQARDILSKLDTDMDLSNAAFPHLAMRAGTLLGHDARVYRVSFSGEMTYEINVPAGAAQALWDALLRAGEPYGIRPFGIEALMLLRLEKGFLHLGTDTDGTTVPDDVGWGKAAAAKKGDFVGKRSLLLPEHVRPNRLQLVGLRGEGDIVVGSHLRFAGGEVTDGWVTSAGRSALSGAPIALAMLRGGRSRIGTYVSVHDADQVSPARVVEPMFFDPPGERMNA